ncbi:MULTISPECIES: LysR family transcriptional regulator [unclassified Streptomyces]|uniref:LysR family transcriptional regulator n=1 Tax=unclassified Streptomyces TaxID=2593676 RepID=UPI00036AF338|nr:MULTISPECIES: LysR family transcriptional regulator [unclassified Streptomyces]
MLDAIPEEIPGREELRLLQLLAENGSLEQASQRSRQSQETLSRRLNRLERRLGAPLVENHRNRQRLTRDGWSLLVAGTRLVSTLESLHLGGAAPGEGCCARSRLSTLRMATPETDCCDITDCLARHVPDIILSAEGTHPAGALDLFERYAVDAAYLWEGDGTPQCRRPSTSQLVLEEPQWVALPVGHRCADRSSVELAELAEDPWVVGVSEDSHAFFARTCRGRIAPRVGYVVERESEMRGLVSHGQGVALVSPLTVVSCTSGFVIRPLRDVPARRYVLITDPGAVGAQLSRTLTAALRSAYISAAERINSGFRCSRSFPVRNVEATAAGAGDAALLRSLALSSAQRARGQDVSLEVEDLHLLRVVGKCGSLNRAAPVLLITQPALTRRIGRLEERLGVRLLQRGPRGTVLTQAAQQLMDAVRDAETGFVSVLLGLRGEPVN